MTSPFKLLCQSCGLSLREATAFLQARPDTAQSWWLGRRNPPEGILRDLRKLFARIDEAAWQGIAQLDEVARRAGSEPEQIELGVSSDDHEAQSLGWPCVGAHEAVLRVMLENLLPEKIFRITIVPRGSTAATAAAADIHEKTRH